MMGDTLKNCRTSYKCYNCRGKNHHTSICENTTNIDDKKDSIDINEENEEKVAMVIDAKTHVLLQTADCIISNPRETKELKIKVLLDPGSQKTYLSDAVKDYLKLDAIAKQNVVIKTFGSTIGKLKELGEFKFALRGLHGNCLRLYMSGFSVPVVYGRVSGQKIDFVKSSYPFLRDLKLADSGQSKGKIDLLIGADFYWSVVDGAVKRGDDVSPVALGLKLGWLLSGPVTKHKFSCLTAHTENVMQIANFIIDEKKIENFWNLDLLGIQEN